VNKAKVRQIATAGSNMQRIAEVIKQMKADFTKPLRVEELAEQANMFCCIVPPSLQGSHLDESAAISKNSYAAARQMMLAENADATQAAYQVGYESTAVQPRICPHVWCTTHQRY